MARPSLPDVITDIHSNWTQQQGLTGNSEQLDMLAWLDFVERSCISYDLDGELWVDVALPFLTEELRAQLLQTIDRVEGLRSDMTTWQMFREALIALKEGRVRSSSVSSGIVDGYYPIQGLEAQEVEAYGLTGGAGSSAGY
ncbi:hypothetical protein D9758_009082 [Tetrapyrgos nigripes]|uniref:Uncharacterized protein n=1 Tax=Tetrapyrgos nigripes TaxID=182062 RepID=A0A8H5GA13_9AGAR|nr:hypothetical protein D9758_009082 [Tetrapyrgos nigripes]